MFKSSNETKFVAGGNLKEGFTTIPNEIMNDIPVMGANAFTIFAKILQYITNENHKINVQGLATQTGFGKRRVSEALNKLIEIGYIKRTPIKNGNIINGYTYEVFATKQIENIEKKYFAQPVENTNVSRYHQNEDTEIGDIETGDTENGYANNNYINNNYNKNNYINNNNYSESDVVAKQTKLFDLYKSFKIEKRFTPHMSKLLLEYCTKFDLDVFEQVFIAVSSENVKSKYSYMKKVFSVLVEKNIKTIDDYNQDQLSRKKVSGKTQTQKKKVDSIYHGTFNQHVDKYSENELESNLRRSKATNNDFRYPLYQAALEDGLSSFSVVNQQQIIDYCRENNLELPKQ